MVNSIVSFPDLGLNGGLGIKLLVCLDSLPSLQLDQPHALYLGSELKHLEGTCGEPKSEL